MNAVICAEATQRGYTTVQNLYTGCSPKVENAKPPPRYERADIAFLSLVLSRTGSTSKRGQGVVQPPPLFPGA